MGGREVQVARAHEEGGEAGKGDHNVKASEHRARATLVNILLCARWEVTDFFLSLRTFCGAWSVIQFHNLDHTWSSMLVVPVTFTAMRI